MSQLLPDYYNSNINERGAQKEKLTSEKGINIASYNFLQA